MPNITESLKVSCKMFFTEPGNCGFLVEGSLSRIDNFTGVEFGALEKSIIFRDVVIMSSP
jgi:hypothetical protein